MPVQRKVFRIEQMSPVTPPAASLTAVGGPEFPHRDVLDELQALRALIERPLHKPATDPAQTEATGLRQLKDEAAVIRHAIGRIQQELAALHSGTPAGEPGRATRELEAVAEGAERATRQIINAAEAIEDAANTLSACLKRGQEQTLAEDIQDQVIRIFEACNFQDLSGQRISKVMATLNFVEDHVARMMQIWGGIEAFKNAAAATAERTASLHGPKLHGDAGHATQDEIDALFAAR
jgi:chemotaxis protein CheZ